MFVPFVWAVARVRLSTLGAIRDTTVVDDLHQGSVSQTFRLSPESLPSWLVSILQKR